MYDTSYLMIMLIFLIMSIIPIALAIVLVVKIWRMTNDIKEINHNLFEIGKLLEETKDNKLVI